LTDDLERRLEDLQPRFTQLSDHFRDLLNNTMASKPKPKADGSTVRGIPTSEPKQSRSADQMDEDAPQIGLVRLSVLALIVGVATGFGAIVFSQSDWLSS
jgi:hypothetical protein